jgi:hypothetical protein
MQTTSKRRSLVMHPITRLVFAATLLPSTLFAAVERDAGPEGLAPPPAPGASVPYLVITDRQLAGAFTPLIHARTRDGLPAEVVTLQEIEEAFPGGVDLAERIRMFLQEAYANRGARWVLLGGDASVIPMRRARIRITGVSPPFPDIDLPTDQYYACLDGSWNTDGDGLWGENPLPPNEPGDAVDFFPELFVGRAPVATPAEVSAFVRRTLDYEQRLAGTAPRTSLLAADVIGGIVDGAILTENLRPSLETDPDREVVRLYENAAAWPGSMQESRATLLDAFDGGQDLAVLVGSGGQGIIAAGQEPADYVTSDDLLGLGNAPLHPFVYVMSAYTNAPDPPLSIGAALMRARHGGAAAVIGTTELQFVSLGDRMSREFFARALAPEATPVGAALANAIAALHAGFTSDFVRLSTQGAVLLGDPALRVDRSGAPPAPDRRHVFPARAQDATPGIPAAAIGDDVEGLTLAIGGDETHASRAALFSQHAAGHAEPAVRSQIVLENPSPSPARAFVALRFELPDAARSARYELAVFDLLGRRVRALAAGVATPGRVQIAWDLRSDAGLPVPDGVYHVRLSFAGTSVSRRMVVSR